MGAGFSKPKTYFIVRVGGNDIRHITSALAMIKLLRLTGAPQEMMRLICPRTSRGALEFTLREEGGIVIEVQQIDTYCVWEKDDVSWEELLANRGDSTSLVYFVIDHNNELMIEPAGIDGTGILPATMLGWITDANAQFPDGALWILSICRALRFVEAMRLRIDDLPRTCLLLSSKYDTAQSTLPILRGGYYKGPLAAQFIRCFIQQFLNGILHEVGLSQIPRALKMSEATGFDPEVVLARESTLATKTIGQFIAKAQRPPTRSDAVMTKMPIILRRCDDRGPGQEYFSGSWPWVLSIGAKGTSCSCYQVDPGKIVRQPKKTVEPGVVDGEGADGAEPESRPLTRAELDADQLDLT
jgi:hypothetical protein